MSGDEFRAARLSLGLDVKEAAAMLGYSNATGGEHILRLERDRRAVTGPVIRLMRIYLSGFRPSDWPEHLIANKKGAPHG